MTTLRAAIIAIALVACGDKADKPAGSSNGPSPTPGSNGPSGSNEPSPAPVVVDAAVAPTVDAEAVAAPDDAGKATPTDDAGTKDDEEARKKRIERLERALERRRQRNLGP